MSSTEDLVTISAAPTSAPGGAGTFSLVANDQILRLRPGAGAYASNQSGALELGVVTQGAQFQAPFSVLDQANGTALRARLGEARAEFFTDTVVNGGLSVTGLSQFAGVEASGVVAEQVVWVTGDGALAQSIMFPGSLQLGQWRLRAVDSGQTVLEWFSSELNAWRQVTSFTQSETTGLQTERLRSDSILIGQSDLGIGENSGLAAWINGKLRTTDDLETTARLRTDAIESLAGGPVRVGNDLNVEGPLSADSITATSEVVTDRFRASTASAVTCADNMVVTGSLTAGGVDVGAALAAREPAFTAVAPLQKVVNIQTGAVELRVDTSGLGGSPFFCAGTVDADGTVLTRKGQRPNFTCTQYGTGAYEIFFEEPHPAGANFVVNLTGQTFHVWVRASNEAPTATGFKVGVVNSSNSVLNLPFYFAVLM
jgi:hypothetical protein